jgi:hypothetical protein
MGWTFPGSNPGRGKGFSLLQKPSRLTLRPTRPRTRVLAHERPWVEVHHLHPMSRSRMSAAIFLLLVYTENFHTTAILLLYIFQKYYSSKSCIFLTLFHESLFWGPKVLSFPLHNFPCPLCCFHRL